MKIGLVLSGGGGKGAYEVGVWKALKELNIDKYISVFSGTSIGAFNAVLFAQDDMEAAEELWKEVTMDKLVPLSKFDLMKKGIGLVIGGKNINLAKKFMTDQMNQGAVSKDGALEIINKYLSIEKIKENGKICYAACTEIPDFKVKYFKVSDYEEEIGKNMVLASASLPLIYECTEVFEKKYIDGGITDNTPIQPVYGEGCDIIITVLLSKEVRIDKSLYPNTKIIEIYPRNLEEKVLDGTLNLEAEAKKRRILEGYNDTIEKLEPIMELVSYMNNSKEEEQFPRLYKIYKWFKKIM